jgi:hypothetical protein|tara:strand:- start:928 stop:1131 length:204 start_codon:yes stop_codon:yes gene_type:complete
VRRYAQWPIRPEDINEERKLCRTSKAFSGVPDVEIVILGMRLSYAEYVTSSGEKYQCSCPSSYHFEL